MKTTIKLIRNILERFNLIANLTAKNLALLQWTAQQIIEAFPWDTALKYLIRDRDSIYGKYFKQRVKNMGIKEVLSAPRSLW